MTSLLCGAETKATFRHEGRPLSHNASEEERAGGRRRFEEEASLKPTTPSAAHHADAPTEEDKDVMERQVVCGDQIMTTSRKSRRAESVTPSQEAQQKSALCARQQPQHLREDYGALK